MSAILKFVGHAGFLLSSRGIVLLTDPWLFGSAFNNGWDLLTPSLLSDEDAAGVTHIWISHEHPDHFSPACMKDLLSRCTAGPVVLFQPTSDRRVLDWCDKAGFDTQELSERRWTELSAGFDVMVGKSGLYDSWSAIRADGSTVVNLNDCMLFGQKEVEALADRVGSVDCLVTQFSYANWIGNPTDIELRSSEATARVQRIASQIEGLSTPTVIPAASFVWFSHEENFYLNDLRVPLEVVVDVIEKAGSTAVVLAPGDAWTVGAAWNNDESADVYERAWGVDGRELHHSAEVPFGELTALAESYVERVTDCNNRLLLRIAAASRTLRVVRIHLWDLDNTVEFHPLRGLTVIGTGDRDSQVSMGSESLAFALRFDWGIDTLLVNGRFRSATSSETPLFRAFWPSALNNSGLSLTVRGAF
jgi:UDP-MurNAc hydroxylase